MAMLLTCPKCGYENSIATEMAGRPVQCARCREWIPLTPPSANAAEQKTVRMLCPSCAARLRVSRKFHGRRVRCSSCQALLAVSADPWELSVLQAGRAGPPPGVRNGTDRPRQADSHSPWSDSAPQATGAAPLPGALSAAGVPPSSETDDGDPIVLVPVVEPVAPQAVETSSPSPVEDEIVLIPIPPEPSPTSTAAEGSPGGLVPAAAPKRRYFTPTLIVGIVLGAMASLGCLAAAALPWMDVPQPPGSGGARFAGSLLFGSQFTDAALGSSPPTHKFWWFPLALPAITLISVFLPNPRLRGFLLLGLVLASTIAGFLMVDSLQGDMKMWTPLARYLQTPHLSSSQPMGPPQLGLGVWVMAGVGVLLLAAAAVNLCHSLPGTVVVVGPVFAAGLFGLLYLNHWFLGSPLRVQVEGKMSKPVVEPEGFLPATSKAMGFLSLRNRARHPLVLVPARLHAEARGQRPGAFMTQPQATGIPVKDISGKDSPRASWFSSWGQPDLVVNIEPDGTWLPDKMSGKGELAITFGERNSMGCVVRPNESVRIAVCFEPVWDRKLAAWDSLAGKWLARFTDASGNLITAVHLNVEAISHPLDRQIGPLLKKYHDATTAVEKRITPALCLPTGTVSLENGPTSSAAQSLVRRFQELRRSLQVGRDCVVELTRLGVPSVEPEKAHLEKLWSPFLPCGESFGLFLDAVAQKRIPEALTQLEKVRRDTAAPGEFARSLQRLLPAILVEQADALLQEQRPDDAAALLQDLEEKMMPDAKLRRKAAAVLASAVVSALRNSQTMLIKPNGDLGGSGRDFGPLSTPESGVPAGPAPHAPYSIGPMVSPPPPPSSAGSKPSPSSDYPLAAASRRAMTWDETLQDNEDFRYADLLIKKGSGTLEETDVIAFGKMRPKVHLDEASCWLGMKSLQTGNSGGAVKYFTYVAKTRPDGPYQALTQLGKELAAYPASKDDVLERIAGKRKVLAARGLRQDWAADVMKLLPPGCSGRPSDLDWADGLTLIAKAEDLPLWLAGQKASIPWLRFSGQELPAPLLRDLMKVVNDGGIVFVNAPLFEQITSLHCGEPDPPLLQNRAVPVHDWGKKNLRYPFLREVTDVIYDVNDSRKLLNLQQAVAAGNKVEGFLQVDRHWLACAARLYPPNRGAIVFLPDRIADTPDGEKFLKLLMEFSKTAVQANRTKGPAAAPLVPSSPGFPGDQQPRPGAVPRPMPPGRRVPG